MCVEGRWLMRDCWRKRHFNSNLDIELNFFTYIFVFGNSKCSLPRTLTSVIYKDVALQFWQASNIRLSCYVQSGSACKSHLKSLALFDLCFHFHWFVSIFIQVWWDEVLFFASYFWLQFFLSKISSFLWVIFCCCCCQWAGVKKKGRSPNSCAIC